MIRIDSPLPARSLIAKRDIPTVEGLLTIVTVTVSQLQSKWPWRRIRRDIDKPILYATCTSRVTDDLSTADLRQRCVSELQSVDETEDSINELWGLCKEAARVREAVAVVDCDRSMRSRVVCDLLAVKAVNELREAARILDSEATVQSSVEICEACKKNNRNL